MTPQELKASILQLAIQGKLVEQRPEEGTGAELLDKILAAKDAKRESRAKSAKESRLASKVSFSVEDAPFDIPESWVWVRLGNLFDISRGGSPRPIKAFLTTEENGLNWIKIGDTEKNSKYINSCQEKIIPAGLSKTRQVYKGDLLLTNSMSFGRPYILNIDGCIHDGWLVLHPLDAELFKDFFFYLLSSPVVFHQFQVSAAGAVVQNLNSDKVAQTVIPLPPLAEQKRIVAKIEELLPLIDRYEKAWGKLEDFNKRFPVDMQKSLLQMAIQGKLVEQRPEEGTGAELYKQIQAEKQRLIKAGKIKKEKPLPEITDDEIPFDIPESWKWYRIGEIFNIVNGFTPLKSNLDFWTNGDIPWFTIEDVHRQGRFISSTAKFITEKALSKGSERIVPADTVLLCCTASIGEYAYAKIPLTTNQQFNAFVVKPWYQRIVYPLYVFEFVKTLKARLIGSAGKTTFNFLSVGKLSNMLMPLPPLAEQKRIVAKLEELLPLCARLR